MRTTVIKASKKLAEKISAELLAINSKVNPGLSVFIRVETETGFKIQNRNKKSPIRVFEFWSVPAPKIEYNPDIVSIN